MRIIAACDTKRVEIEIKGNDLELLREAEAVVTRLLNQMPVHIELPTGFQA
jgi:hypothetical protein